MTSRIAPAAGVAPLALALAAVLGVSSLAGEMAGHRAPQRLADTGLYQSGRPGVIDPRNRAFAPQYPLWSDGASKARWIYLPPGERIDATDATEWDFPVGTRLWKEFAFGGRKVETRMLWRASEAGWIAASYIWSADGTDAILAPPEGVPGLTEIAAGRRHSVPSTADCAACHGSPQLRPLGFTALQLSTDRDPHAIHGEPLAPEMITLATLVSEGLLSPRRTDLIANPPRIATSNPQARAVLGYMVANCGSCHGRAGEVAAVEPFFQERELLEDGNAVARALVGRVTRWMAPGQKSPTLLLDPGDPDASAILMRMRSRRPSSQMPPLGTVVRDDDAVEALARWIESEIRIPSAGGRGASGPAPSHAP